MLQGPTPDPLRDALVAALGAQYEVVRLIGRGGMGAVYLGHERLLDRPVAIKVLPHETAGFGDARDRFLREARIAARLTHPNIVPLFSFGEAGKTLFYVMGYVEGESLEQRLRRASRLSFDESRRVLSQLSAALEHAHALGIVHRDIKPDNVLIETGTGRIVLTDFGIARQQSGAAITRTGMIMGTPHYMSPEQASGDREIDGRSDIYALGVLGYRIISGRLPFDGGSMQEVMAQQVARDPVPLNVVAPEIPADLDVAVARSLAKDPAARWRDASQLRASLTGDALQTLPDELEKLPAIGSTCLFVAYAIMWSTLLLSAGTGDPTWLFVMPYVTAMVTMVGPAMMFREGRKAKIPWKRLVQMAFWPPNGWRFWWPRALRRPDDVWDRLPRQLRITREIISAGSALALGIAIPAMLLGFAYAIPDSLSPGDFRSRVRVLTLFGTVAQGLAVGAIGVAFVAHLIKHRKLGLTPLERDRLLQEATSGSRFWTRPEIARLLLPEGASTRGIAAPESPGQIVAAIQQQSSATDQPLRDLLKEAATAARDMARAIEAIDSELRDLAAHDAAAELERLQQKISALGAARENDSPATVHMRQLYASQLELMRGLEQRGRDLADRRTRYVELLRVLWLQVSALRSHHTVEALGIQDVSGPIRELCRRAQDLAAGDRAVASMITYSEAPTTPLPG